MRDSNPSLYSDDWEGGFKLDTDSMLGFPEENHEDKLYGVELTSNIEASLRFSCSDYLAEKTVPRPSIIEELMPEESELFQDHQDSYQQKGAEPLKLQDIHQSEEKANETMSSSSKMKTSPKPCSLLGKRSPQPKKDLEIVREPKTLKKQPKVKQPTKEKHLKQLSRFVFDHIKNSGGITETELEDLMWQRIPAEAAQEKYAQNPHYVLRDLRKILQVLTGWKLIITDPSGVIKLKNPPQADQEFEARQAQILAQKKRIAQKKEELQELMRLVAERSAQRQSQFW